MINRVIFRNALRAAPRSPLRPLLRFNSTEATNPIIEETPASISDATGPPLLLKIREDLKTALQNKDTPRLTAIRTLINAVNSKPVKTDIQLLGLIKRSLRESTVAIEHYKIAEREDLVEKESLQSKVFEEYSKLVDVLDDETITKVLEGVINDLKEKNESIKFGYVLHKGLSSPDLPSSKVNRGDVVRCLQKLLPYGK